MKTKKLVKQTRKILKILHFKKGKIETKGMEKKSYLYVNGVYSAYIHTYRDSLRFYITNSESGEECRFELWKDKEKIKRPTYDNGITFIFDFVFKNSCKLINK